MRLENTVSQSLLVINTRAGNGHAAHLAGEITANHELETIDIGGFFALEQTQRDELLASLSHIFVLGGDGSAFSLLNFLLSQNLQNKIIVTPLGLGGENVLAKSVGSFGKSVLTVTQVLSGKHTVQQLQPFTVQLQSEAINLETLPFLWSVHAGFSATVLAQIEVLRNGRASDFQRRYGGTLKSILQLRGAERVTVSGTGIDTKQVLDFGVVSSALPYWTSKLRLPVSNVQSAILHTVEGCDQLQTEPVAFTSRFLLELILLKLGLEVIPRKILKHQALGADFTIQASTPSGQIGVDSEIYLAQSAIATNSTNTFSRNVFLGRV